MTEVDFFELFHWRISKFLPVASGYLNRKLKKQLDPVVLRVVDNSAKYGAAAETYYK